MRREQLFRMPQTQALALLARAPWIHLAGISSAGEPIFRTVHGVIVDDYLAYHGAPAGEKSEAVGRPVVAAAENVVASIPSYFMDPMRACPATTLYQSVQVHGVLEPLTEAALKAKVLQALMDKYQPEGGYEPITATHPLYANAVRGLSVVGIRLEKVDGKAKLGQNRTAEEQIKLIENLWRRGAPGDTEAISLILAANPQTPRPAFLNGPVGLALDPALTADHLEAAVDLLRGQYWNQGLDDQTLAEALRSSSAWVGAKTADGVLVGSARAISDFSKNAWIYDVIVHPSYRGQGLGKSLVRFLLDHPAVRRAQRVHLGTRDAQELYRKMGFVETAATARGAASTDMVLVRD